MKFWSRVVGSWFLGLAGVAVAHAQVCNNVSGQPNIGYRVLTGTVPASVNCAGLYSCRPPVLFDVYYQTQPPSCDLSVGSCSVRAYVPFNVAGNSHNDDPNFRPLVLEWTAPGGAAAGSCGAGANLDDEKAEGWIQLNNFNCGSPAGLGLYKLKVRVCPCLIPPFCPCTEHSQTVDVDLSGPAIAAAVCPPPPPPPMTHGCGEDDGCSMGCLGPGGGAAGGGAGAGGGGQGGSPPAGGGPGLAIAGSGPGARLRYQAGGTGHADHPKPADWNTILGRYWSHDYAERIVQDPDLSHVWLLTRWATYREFTDAGIDGTYETAVPSDEYRQLTKSAGGWELRELDGMVHIFDNQGRWTSTTDRYGNAKIAAYDGMGRLTGVTFPDGRSETFVYDGSARLQSITEVGVDGLTTRSWTYTWSGQDLTRIDRPDGTAMRFEYGDAGHSGYMTRLVLVGTDDSERIEGAWEYEDGNVVATWKGTATKTDPNVVELWQLSFDDPEDPVETTVTDPLGNESVYTFGRDPAGRKPRLEQTSGDCPTCGLGPNSQLSFTDPLNPLRPTQRTDGRGFTTVMTYDVNGQMTSRTEAFMESEERTASWEYDATFPELVTYLERPSVTGNPADLRTVDYTRDGFGNVTDETHDGFEDGSTFSLTTVRTYTTEGMVETIDPPGHGTADVTSFEYDPARGGLILEERTDALIGVTTFEHDAFNRRTSVTDPNGVVAETEYDLLDRVRFVRQKGATMADDLVTEYRYNVFGDLFQTVMPEGNVIEYSYDAAGRLLTIERKPDDQPTSHGECVRYVLDDWGHRVLEAQERWETGAWVEHARTAYQYSTRCHLDKVIAGTGADQSTTEYAYDCNGNLDRVWDANHPSNGQTNPATSVYQYDALDRLTSVAQPFGGPGGGTVVTSYGYDVQDHLTQVEDGEGTVTAYAYSDRDLMTEETSEVSGTTTYTYGDHGELATKTDARGITETRTVDALDRVTLVDYPGTDLDIEYTYDDPLVAFSKGRLTSLERNGEAIAYEYDRFGRVTQDGQMAYLYDKNGNRTTISYPGGVDAQYTFDYADRPQTLDVDRPGDPTQSVVTSAAYYPSGPLQTLSLGNGRTENRGYDSRYYPASIGIPTLFNWTYTVDDVGNPTAVVNSLDAGDNRSYAYQDVQYYLTQGNGPWGTRTWTYDNIGNRLTESKNGATADIYIYVQNLAGGNSPKLDQVNLGTGGSHDFTFDLAGNQTQVDLGASVIGRDYDAASRMSRQERIAGQAETDLRYDGRGFLVSAAGIGPADPASALFCDGFESGDTSAWGGAGLCLEEHLTQPVYSTDGRLHAVQRATTPQQSHVLYFADRPVAQLDVTSGVANWLYLTTDHLGTPVLASDEGGSEVWFGGFEPFGADWSGAEGAGVYLRFPGQWADRSWEGSSEGDPVVYNVFRWYGSGVGRYNRPDPIRLRGFGREYGYASANPIGLVDTLGLSPALPGCDGWCAEKRIAEPGTYAAEVERVYNAVAQAGAASRETVVKKCYEEKVATGLGSIRCESDERCREVGGQQDPPVATVGGFWDSNEPGGISLCPRAAGLPGYSGCTLARILAHEVGHFCTEKGHSPMNEPHLEPFNRLAGGLEIEDVKCPRQ